VLLCVCACVTPAVASPPQCMGTLGFRRLSSKISKHFGALEQQTQTTTCAKGATCQNCCDQNYISTCAAYLKASGYKAGQSGCATLTAAQCPASSTHISCYENICGVGETTAANLAQDQTLDTKTALVELDSEVESESEADTDAEEAAPFTTVLKPVLNPIVVAKPVLPVLSPSTAQLEVEYILEYEHVHLDPVACTNACGVAYCNFEHEMSSNPTVTSNLVAASNPAPNIEAITHTTAATPTFNQAAALQQAHAMGL